MNDIRVISTAAALLAAIIGYIILVLNGSTEEASDLLKLVGLPALTFLIGIGSTIKNGK